MSRQADARTGARISLPSIPQSGCNRRSCAPQLATSMRAIRGGEDRPSRRRGLLLPRDRIGYRARSAHRRSRGRRTARSGEGSTAQRRNRPGLGSHTRGHLRQPVHLRSPLSSGRQASRPTGQLTPVPARPQYPLGFPHGACLNERLDLRSPVLIDSRQDVVDVLELPPVSPRPNRREVPLEPLHTVADIA